MSAQARLSVMMFLQFFTWGAWFATLGKCLADNGLGDFGGGAYGSAPIAAIIAPLFLGLIADRFFASERVMGVLLLLGGIILCLAPQYAAAKDGRTLVWLFTAHMLCYMPTLGLSNTITFTNISDKNLFPQIRVWGTIGWIVAGLTVGFLGWSASFNIFYLAGICSLILGAYCFSLPHTPPPAKGKPLNVRTLLMLDAFGMMKSFPFAVFMICSGLICIPLAYYFGLTSNLLGQVGFEAPASTMTLGQMSEIFFMILIPFFFRRLGVKWMILVGMVAWVLRYVLFAFGAADQVVWMILLAILLHGVCYDFFFVTGFMYTDAKAPNVIRSQAQSLLVFFTQGIGMYFGYMLAFDRFGASVTKYQELATAMDAAKPQVSLTFAESLGRVFSVHLPEGVNPTLLTETMQQWKEFWLLPAGMAAAVLVAFAVLFHDKYGSNTNKSTTSSEEAPR
ncbi:MAG: MFS transporter [Planctomycetes bacterium]|nr:MFS transporter [Planctomycetota bacterium]